MGNYNSTYNKINYKDLQDYIFKNKSDEFIILNTLNESEQNCLIHSSINSKIEEKIINDLLKKKQNINIIIYGKNSNDLSIYTKYNQLIELGFSYVYIYVGGLFEWLLLQDIYGDDEFPTNEKELDILKYSPKSHFQKLICN